MVPTQQNACGTINRCSCGRVILQIQTTKSAEARSLVARPMKQSKAHPPRGLKAFTSRGKKAAETKKEEALKTQATMCLNCSQKSKREMERKTDRLNRVKVACSLSKLTNKKKENISTLANSEALPREISLFVNGNGTTTTPLTDAARFQQGTNTTDQQGYIYSPPPPKVTKMEPCRFTFEGLGMSHSSTMDSILAMSTDDQRDEFVRDPQHNNGAKSNMKMGLGLPHGSAPSLEGTIQSDMTQVTSDNSLVSWQGGKTHPKNISEQVRSIGSQLSTEFSEAELLRSRNTQDHNCKPNTNGPNNTYTMASAMEGLAAAAAAMRVTTSPRAQNDEEQQANVQTYFDCESGENLFWVFDFNPPKAGEEKSLQNMLQGELTAKQVWFDLNSLFGMS
jgi:hypothetical protein